MKFKVGEIVQLKSGGPKMTVKTISDSSDNDTIYCHWFAGSKLSFGRFAPETLIKVDDIKEDKNGKKSK